MEKIIFIAKPLIKFVERVVIQTYYTAKSSGRKLQHKLTDIVEGILYMCKTGIQINLAEYKGIPGSALMYHFYKWVKDDIFYKEFVAYPKKGPRIERRLLPLA